MNTKGKGFSTRYDNDLGGNHIQMLRDTAPGLGVFLPYSNYRTTRFCETCGQLKPKGTRKAVKGWKCDDCLKKERKK